MMPRDWLSVDAEVADGEVASEQSKRKRTTRAKKKDQFILEAKA